MVISRWSAHSFARPCFNSPMSRLYASIDQVHVPGLALVITQLTVTQPELLLAVPMNVSVPVQRCRYTRTIRLTSQVIRLVTRILQQLSS